MVMRGAALMPRAGGRKSSASGFPISLPWLLAALAFAWTVFTISEALSSVDDAMDAGGSGAGSARAPFRRRAPRVDEIRVVGGVAPTNAAPSATTTTTRESLASAAKRGALTATIKERARVAMDEKLDALYANANAATTKTTSRAGDDVASPTTDGHGHGHGDGDGDGDGDDGVPRVDASDVVDESDYAPPETETETETDEDEEPSSLGGDDYVDPDEPAAKESPSAPVAAAESEERFLSSARPLPKSVYARADQLVNVPGFPRSPPLVLSATRPKAYLFRNFLTEEECRHLIALAKAQLAPSTVVADGGKKSTKSGIRTSAGMFLTKGQTPTVRMVEERVAAAVGLPEENGEGMQILRYEHGQKYDPHYDYFHDKINPSPNRGGQRMATMLIYLKDTEEGGETIFPNAKKPEGFHDGEKDGAFSDCAKRGLPVKSKRGDAVLFWSLTSDYKLDEGSLHGACPVLRGEKWTAVKWIRVAKFDGRFTGELPMPSLTRGDRAAVDATARCVDEWDECAEWARKGWCERNPEFMTGVNGARDSKGPACAVSCGAPCPPLLPGSA